MPRVPRVSVGMPVYNGERFVRAAIESVLAQTYGDLELIVSDNASTDGTADICREYAARDPRIRYVRRESNVGAARNFNTVFGLARGEYYKLANADDVSAPALVARCVAVLDAHPEAVLCYARTTLIDEHDAVLGEYDDGLDLRAPRAADRFRAALHRIGLVNVLQGVTRARALRATGLEGCYLHSDVLLVEELTLHGCFREVPERLFFRRMHREAASSLASAESRLRHIDPSAAPAPAPVVARHLLERLAAVARAPLPAREKAVLAGIAARDALGDRQRLWGQAAAWAHGRLLRRAG